MNKKRWIIVIIVFFIICLLGVGYLIWNKKENNTTSINEIITEKDWLNVTSVSELKTLAEKTDKSVEYEYEYAYVADLPFGEGKASYGYEFDENEQVVSLSIGYMLVTATEADGKFTMEDISLEEFQNRTENALLSVSQMLGVNIENNYYIISETDEILPVDDESSYQQILDCTAFLETRILDVDDSVWVLTIENMPMYNIVTCSLEHHLADSEEAQIPCNIAIEK